MKPTRDPDDALVDLVDVLLAEGVLVQADVLVSVADIPLVGIELRAAVAGLATMREYGLLADWDREVRREAERAGRD
ncbi:gas vesicle protein GvpM [Haloarchaeobius amylolyticus]|uniref:gas vesicle protein GvpM n=1 Tax=Haloarchaeobius amylolyticus TaxID=1198296 RepID=UPI00226E6B91